jgi:hypothetical protein
MIFKIPKSTTAGPDWRDLNQDGTVSFVEKAAATAGATGLLGSGVWVLLQLAFVGACGLLSVGAGDAWDAWKETYAWLTLLLTALAGLGLYTWRMLTPEKSERLTKAQIEHQSKMQLLELERARLELANLQGIADHEPNSTYSQIDIDAAARLILLRYYQGEKWSRDAMVEAGVVKKAVWDKANGLLVSRKIRTKKRMVAEDFAAAWGMYVEGSQKAQKREWKGGGLIDTR